MGKKLRWGILGVAKINRKLVPAFTHARSADLKGIASRSLARAQEAARAAHIPKSFGSYEELLDDPDIDAVYVPLPNTLHGEWSCRAADKGKHVLCEKPLAPTAAEAARIVEHCRQKNVKLMDGFMWPHHVRTARLRGLIDSGTLGTLRHVHGCFTFRMDSLELDNIRLQAELGGGSLLDVGCYPVYGIRWALGEEPVEVFARAEFRHEVDVAMTGQLWFASGATASFDCGFTMPLRQHLEIVGSEAVLRIDEMWVPSKKTSFSVQRNEELPDLTVIENEDQIAHMLDDFGAAVLEDKAVTPAPEEAVKTLRVLEALTRSARAGTVIRLD
ncbi:MAG: Gfo/Idh/MocA family protein [Gemmataceae bacterium]